MFLGQLFSGNCVKPNNGIHRGLLEQRLKRLQHQLKQLNHEVELLDGLQGSSPTPTPGTLQELGYSLKAEILRLNQELDATERELQRHKDSLLGDTR